MTYQKHNILWLGVFCFTWVVDCFFHMDAFSSAVAMKVNLDPQLTLMASSLYRLVGAKVSNGYQRAKSRHIFRDLVDGTATIMIDQKNITVRFQKRVHNPLLLLRGSIGLIRRGAVAERQRASFRLRLAAPWC